MNATRILVVEDEHLIAINLRDQLTQLGYQVPSAVATGETALRRIEEAPPDLVLMDIQLAGPLDGIATAAAITASYDIPVIYLTAHSGSEILQRATATGPYGYLLKPFTSLQLQMMIQVVLARRQAERAHRAALEHQRQAAKMRALSLFAGEMADEVNDLLTILYDHLELLGRHVIHDPVMTQTIRNAFDEAIEKERLVNRLHDFSGRDTPAPETVPVQDLVTQVADRFREISGDDVQIRTLLPEDLWQARIDAGQLRRCLSNVAVNACEAMPDGGSLTIEACNIFVGPDSAPWAADVEPGRYVMLSLADSGPGMATPDIERAFEPFFTTKPAGARTGLGLSLVFAFIRRSGGHVCIESKPNQGTRVMLYLPAAVDGAVENTPQLPGVAREDRCDAATGRDDAAADVVPATTAASAAGPWRRYGSHWLQHKEDRLIGDDEVWRVPWHRSDNALFASVSSGPARLHYRLVIEPLPARNGWDWAVWRSGDACDTSRHGRAASLEAAMADAEDAAKTWDEVRTEAPVTGEHVLARDR